ncbi:MAG: glutamate mutase L [Acidobacteria bacterium]|nr:glutamate mutase L [Acidobacteriota bacterium]
MKKVVSIDIGSTWTKGALFALDGPAGPAVLAKRDTPTTQDGLGRGFLAVLTSLLGLPPETRLGDLPRDIPVYFSSSAKGGLAIAAVGLVPDLTLQLAKLTAMSAGGKVVRSFSFSLTEDDIAVLESAPPDMILLSGGTDGGNTAYLFENAARLAASKLQVPVIFAGNRAAASRVARILEKKDVVVTENIMPEIGQMNPEPARDKIRGLFLDRIVAGRGLGEIVEVLGSRPKPTPLGVFELVAAIPRVRPDWDDLCVIDMGGATTDVYSNTESYLETDTVVLKGLREPRNKRTVEGDLGLRVSARTLWDAGREIILEGLDKAGLPAEAMEGFIAAIAADAGLLPSGEPQKTLDRILAEACVFLAVSRHTGGWREAFTPQGRVFVQTGKDLRRVKAVVGSGGYLSRSADAAVMRGALNRLARPAEERKLAPERPAFYADAAGLFPLAGNLAEDYPEEATALALASLKPLS